MASIVEVANQALLMLGQSSIIAMDQDNEAARLCNGLFAYNRDETIRAYPWNCAMARASLARVATTIEWEYSTGTVYKYALPTNPLCLRVLKMKEKEINGYRWKIENRFLVTEATTATILYLKQLTDVNDMDVLLRGAIAARLAAAICYALTGSSTQQDKMFGLYQLKLREAKSIDAQEGTPDEMFDDPFLNARV